MMTVRVWMLPLVAVVLCACESNTSAHDDGSSPDAGSFVLDVPALPSIGSCPPGWQQIEGDLGRRCEPWNDSGPSVCRDDELLLPGVGCTRIGTECPEGEWANDLGEWPGTWYVSANAEPGGLGTRSSPITLDEASQLTGAARIVLGKGTHQVDHLFLSDGAAVLGACVSETIVIGRFGATAPVVVVRGPDVSIDNLTIRAPGRVGVSAPGADIDLPGGPMSIGSTLIESAQENALVIGRGIQVDAHDLILRGTIADDVGAAIYVGDGASLVLERGTISSSANTVALVATGTGAEVTLRSVSVLHNATPQMTAAIHAYRNAHIDASELVVEDNAAAGVSIQGARLTLRDSLIRGHRRLVTAPYFGAGIMVSEGATALIERTRVERNEVAGIITGNAHLIARDLIIEETLGVSDGNGVGISALSNAQVEIERAVLARNSVSGLVSASHSHVRLSDVRIVDTRSSVLARAWGHGITAQDEGQVEGERVYIERNREVGIYASSAGALSLQHVIVSSTLARECADSDCVGFGIGTGVVVRNDGRVTLERFVLENNSLAGAQILEGGQLDLRDGRIRGHEVGINIQVEGYDQTRLADRVIFEQDGGRMRNISRENYPAPEPVPPLPTPR